MTDKIGILLLLLALVSLIPGLTQPIITLTGTVDKAALIELGKKTLAADPDVPALLVTMSERIIDKLNISGELPAFTKSRSIIGTVRELYRADKLLVAFLIALFSIVVPVTKCFLLMFASLAKERGATALAERISSMISKWSMADVFVVAIIVAFLAANATRQTEELFTLDAEFSPGFYYFLAYCILSIFSSQLINSGRVPERV